MNDLVIDSCAVISSVFSSILAKKIGGLRDTMTRKRRKRRFWVRESILRRKMLGATNLANTELKSNFQDEFKNLLRMTESQFDNLLKQVKNLISKSDTNMRQAISAKTKLQITLHYLATGDSFKSLETLFHVPKNTISKFIPDTCEAIHNVLVEFIQVPTTSDDWKNIECGFRTRWNFPGCVGALDGKHIVIRAPPGSIVLLALVDSDYCFLYVDVETKGNGSDGQIFQNSSLYKALETNSLAIPTDFVILADDAFPLKKYLIKPYTQRNMSPAERIYNYRVSRARRVVENAFGILASKFKLFEKPISLKLETLDKVVIACCAIHNWLKKTNPHYLTGDLIDYEDEDHQVFPGSWRQDNNSGLQNLPATLHRHPNIKAQQTRDNYRDYFNNQGAVPWQNQITGVPNEL